MSSHPNPASRTPDPTSHIPHPASRTLHLTLTLSITGLTTRVICNDSALIDRLRRRYRAYLTGDAPQLTANVHLAGQLRSSALLDTGAVFRNGVLHFTAPGYTGFVDEAAGGAELTLSSAYPVEDVDYFLRVVYALLAFRAGGLLFHAAGIVRDGRAYLFFGPSGSGKTTVARLSRDGVVLNDDLVLLMPGAGRWTAHATPFWNPTQIVPAGPHAAPVAGLYRLVKARDACLAPLAPAQALAEVVAGVPVIASDPARGHALLERGRRLLEAVPARRLYFRLDESFWDVVNAQFSV